MKRKNRWICAGIAAMLMIASVPNMVFAQDQLQAVTENEELVEVNNSIAAETGGEESNSVNAMSEGIEIPDPNLRTAINRNLSSKTGTERPDDAAITEEEMKQLTSLTTVNSSITDLTGLHFAENLTSLTVWNDVKGISEIASLNKLQYLTIDDDNMTSLSEIGIEDKHDLIRLTLTNSSGLMDISELTPSACPNLQSLSLENCAQITDITSLKGYTSLQTLNIEKIKITPENRTRYMETIGSLTGLTDLRMPYCGVTDSDTQMFASLQNLETLVLNYNGLKDSSFLNALPKSLECLGLFGNDFNDISNVSRFKNLTILGMGDNYITDFSFVNNLPELTAGDVRNAEGDEDYPMKEVWYYGSEENPVVIENGELKIPNPYIGFDGNPISFKDAVASQGNQQIEFRYEEDTNEIILAGLKSRTINISLDYTLPLLTGESKICELQIIAYVTENKDFAVKYDWGTEAPEGAVLPLNSNRYDNLDAFKASLDTTYNSQTEIKGTKEGKEGTWKFSGWTVPTVIPNNGILLVTGSWSFEEHQHTWGEPSYIWSEDGSTCTAVRVCTENESHKEEETVTAKAEITQEATCTSKGKTTYTAVFESEWAKLQTFVKENVEMIAHTLGESWKKDDDYHWKECTVCADQIDKTAHTFQWIIDKEATQTEDGSKHEECTVCGYEKAAVTIPKTGKTPLTANPAKPTQTNNKPTNSITSVETGDSHNIQIWVCVMIAAGAACVGVVVYSKRKKA